MASFEKLESTFSSDVQVRGKQFEKLLKWWLQTDPVYSARLKKVWLWDEWPGRDGVDIGIDLVAEAHDGGIWAIQAKCIDPKNSLKKSEVDSFLAASSKSPFTFQLLITSTGNLSANLLRVFSGRPAALVTRAELAGSEVDWPLSINHLATGKRKKPRTPRKHQKAAIADVLAGFESSKRGQLIMACGTGKTLTALFIAKETEAKRVLVLLPSLSLLSQTLREWASSDFKFEFLPVCSDETVSTPDAALGSVSELGFPVTTDPEAIATFLKRRSGNRVVFATYQSSPRIAAAFAGGGIPKFDLVIADEAHRCAGRVSSDYGTVLDEDLIPSKKLLFMTATPRYFTGRVIKEAKESDFEVASMDDHQVFGPVFHTLSFSDAIDKKLLTDYQVVIVGVDDDTYLEWVNEGQFVTIDGTKVTDARSLAAQIGLLKAMKRFDLRRIISFHSRVKKAREFASSMPEVLAWMPKNQRPKGSLISDFVSGEMPTGARKVKLDRLATIEPTERALLANARCLTEGVDVPALDGVAFVDPRSSEVDIIQAVGRAIRLSDDKKIGTIVLPIFIPNSQDPSVSLDDPSFQNIWKVIDALRSHDTQLGESLDEIRRGMGSGNSSEQFPKKIQFDLPNRVDVSFSESLEARIVEYTTSNWEFMFGLLERFVAREGTASIAQNHVEDGFNLGFWASNRRAEYRRGQLPLPQAERLDGLRGWSWHLRDSAWEEGFLRLEAFANREKHCLVPASHIENGFKLGNWVTSQRSSHPKGRLPSDRVERLESLPGWSWDALDAKWDEAFSILARFADRESHSRVPGSHSEEHFQLGTWVTSQRTKRSRPLPDQVERLESLPGWSWDPQAEKWEEGFSRLSAFAKREGNVRVPVSYPEEEYGLRRWMQKQRSRHALGRLPSDRVERLESLPGWSWDALAAKWDEGFSWLVEYADREGDCYVPTSHVQSGFKLGTWVNVQRTRYGKRQLDEARVELLEALPGWVWDERDAMWDQMYTDLLVLIGDGGFEGFSRSRTEESEKVGRWLKKQRINFRTGKLSRDRIAQLESIPNWTWEPIDSKWEEGFSRLSFFLEREGTANVPDKYSESGYNLGTWVKHQRSKFRQGRMSTEQAGRLEALPGWIWNLR